MNAPALQLRMTVEQFHDWLDRRTAALPSDEPKWELFDGVPEMQQASRKSHSRIKFRMMKQLDAEIERLRLPFEVDIDGLSVRISRVETYVPDIVVYPVGLTFDDDLVVVDPVLVVEVLSPSTRHKDLSTKVTGYSAVPSIRHYLVADPDARQVLHLVHSGAALVPVGEPMSTGLLTLDPPGVTLDIGAIFG